MKSQDIKTTDMLYSDEVRPNEGDVVNLAEHANNTCMVNTGDHDG